MFWNLLLDLIYKQKCIICSNTNVVQNYDNLLCKNCVKDINYLSIFPHKIYKGINIYSAGIYDKTIKELIHRLKFSNKKRASIILAKILFNYFEKLKLDNDYVVIYPPSYFLRKMNRGYEHMFLITKEFCNLTGLKYSKNVIKKIKNTKPQYKARDRFKNIKGSFKITEKLDKNQNILLIDDIITSGATSQEIIDCLFDMGYKNITCLTISKTINNF